MRMAPWAFMSANEFPWPDGTMLKTTLELSWVLIAPWRQAHVCSWLLMSVHWPIGNQEHSWLLLLAYECSWVLMGPYECSWLLIGTLKQPWTLMCLVQWSNEHSWELKSIYEHSAMGPWGLISTHEHSWCHCTILMRGFESSWALMRGHERPWELMSAKLLY